MVWLVQNLLSIQKQFAIICSDWYEQVHRLLSILIDFKIAVEQPKLYCCKLTTIQMAAYCLIVFDLELFWNYFSIISYQLADYGLKLDDV